MPGEEHKGKTYHYLENAPFDNYITENNPEIDREPDMSKKINLNNSNEYCSPPQNFDTKSKMKLTSDVITEKTSDGITDAAKNATRSISKMVIGTRNKKDQSNNSSKQSSSNNYICELNDYNQESEELESSNDDDNDEDYSPSSSSQFAKINELESTIDTSNDNDCSPSSSKSSYSKRNSPPEKCSLNSNELPPLPVRSHVSN